MFYARYRLPERFAGCELAIGIQSPHFIEKEKKLVKIEKFEGEIIGLNQFHSNRVVVVDSVEEVRGSNNVGADGIITTLKGIWLCVRTADCVPLFIYYPPEPLICAVHIGWRGLAKGIVERTIEILDNRFNIKKAYMHLFMGPAICQKHYPVKEDVVRFFPESVYIKNENSVYNLDIKKAIREKLYRFGVRGEQVFDIGWCTYENPELPSYRREKENLGSEIMNFCRLI